MKKIIFISLTLLTFLQKSPAACTDYKSCVLNFSEQLLLTKQVSKIARSTFTNEWELLVREDQLFLAENMKAQYQNCASLEQLFYAPKGSPIGDVLIEQENIKEASSTKYKKRYFFFETDIQPIRSLAGDTPMSGFGIPIKGAETSEKARSLLHRHNEWQKQFTKESFEKKLEAYYSEFKETCYSPKLDKIKDARNRILQEHTELLQLEGDLKGIEQECEDVISYDFDNTNNRYQSTEVSESRFTKLKRLALSSCSPIDGISTFLGGHTYCGTYIEDIWEIVNPECENRGDQDITIKGNLCNGLHDYIVDQFLKNPDYDLYLRKYINVLRSTRNSGKKIDLLDEAIKAANGSPIIGVRLMALIGHDEVNTSMKSIREKLLSSGQYERLVQADDLYTKELHTDEANDPNLSGYITPVANMTLFREHIKSGSTIGGKPVYGRYYHLVASTFLSCEMRGKGYGWLASSNAAAKAGDIYELYDFYGHLKSGVGFQRSFTNYNDDVSKHIYGGKLGGSICP